MKKHSSLFLVIGLFSLIFLAGCGNPDTYESPITAADEAMMKEIEAKNFEDLTTAEKALIEKFEADAEAAANWEQNQNVEMANALMDLQEQKESGNAAKGHCNAIALGSTCIDYVGSIRSSQQMKLNCEGNGEGVGTYGAGPCPSGMAGGCNIGEGTPADMISRFYLQGGREMTAESIKNAQNACEATPMSKRLTAK